MSAGDHPSSAAAGDGDLDSTDGNSSLLQLLLPIVENHRTILLGTVLAGLAGLTLTFVVPPTYTAATTFLPPQQQQSAAASALASLGAIGGLAGATSGLRTPADQFVSLLQSTTVQDRLVDKFQLMQVYAVDYRVDARLQLGKRVRVSVGKKDGLISVEVDDLLPTRAAAMANQHVDELRRLTAQLALTEAQQRRVFFEGQLKQTRDRLALAQSALQSSGFNASALRTEPKAAADGYAKLRAEATAADVRLQALRRGLTDSAPEVQQQLSALTSLRAHLAQLEGSAEPAAGPDYIGKYRDFKYQETLFDLFSRQYELARIDESKEGALIQVVDSASPPEKRSQPKRRVWAMVGAVSAALLLTFFVIVRALIRRSTGNPANAEQWALLRRAMRRG